MSEETKLADAVASAQLEKLNLEIEHLRNKSRWHDRITPYMPLLSVIIAVCGFLFGIYQFKKQQQIQLEQRSAEQQKERIAQEKDQSIRIQNQIRADLDQILTFPRDKQQTVSRLSFLLDDLKTYLEIEAKEAQGGTEALTVRSRKVSAVLVQAILNDCNFEEHRDVNFATTLLSGWEDVGQYIKENPTYQAQILDKLADAILKIYLKAPEVISEVEMSENTYLYVDGYRELSPSDIFHFQDMVSSYVGFFKLVDSGEMKETKALRFQMATCNPKATNNYFNVSFEPKDIVDLHHCLKKR